HKAWTAPASRGSLLIGEHLRSLGAIGGPVPHRGPLVQAFGPRVARRHVIARAIGPLADEICYEDADDLAGKLELFLATTANVANCPATSARLYGAYSPETLFARTLPLALERLKKH